MIYLFIPVEDVKKIEEEERFSCPDPLISRRWHA
jgi:hypothetical protein